MEAAVVFALAVRLPAYPGAMAVMAQKERDGDDGGLRSPRRVPRNQGRYERGSGMANNARTADSSPPATAASLANLNAQLGSTWFAHRVIKGEGVKPGE